MADRNTQKADTIISFNGKMYIDRRKSRLRGMRLIKTALTTKSLPILIANGQLVPLDASQTSAIAAPQTVSAPAAPVQQIQTTTAATVSIPQGSSTPFITSGGGGITIPSSDSADYMTLFQSASGQQNLAPDSQTQTQAPNDGNKKLWLYGGIAALVLLMMKSKGKRK